jgi:outer membrane protein TolC
MAIRRRNNSRSEPVRSNNVRVTPLEVITAQTIELANERNAIDILRRRMDASMLLVKALGGGWDASKLPTFGAHRVKDY